MSKIVNPLIFREYDIRGVVGEDLTDESVTIVGRAFGTYLREREVRAAFLGRDCRTSSPAFAEAIARGLTACGVDVVDLGVVPTPLLYFSMFLAEAGPGGGAVDGPDVRAGVMVTGSHNPKDFNGFKLCAGRAALFGEQIREVARIALSGRFAEGFGAVTRYDVVPAYLDRVAGDARLGPRRLRVVVDAGNGTGGVVAVPLFERLGVEVIPLYCDMDGEFPHHHPDPTVPKNLEDLRREVVQRGADLGVAYDGDADRLGIVTEKGEIVFGDMVLLVLARALLREHPGATIVSEVKCSQVLFDEVERAGGRAEMWRVGHSLIKARMAETGALLGGEMSGHLFFRHRWFGFDDAIYASLRFIEVLSHYDGPASSLLADVPRTVATPEIRVDCPDEVKFRVVEVLTAQYKAAGYPVVDVDGARVRFSEGWGLVRASNTQPVLVFRFEARSEQALSAIRDEMLARAEAVRQSIQGQGRQAGERAE